MYCKMFFYLFEFIEVNILAHWPLSEPLISCRYTTAVYEIHGCHVTYGDVKLSPDDVFYAS